MWIKVISQIHSSCVLSLVVLSFAFLKTVTLIRANQEKLVVLAWPRLTLTLITKFDLNYVGA